MRKAARAWIKGQKPGLVWLTGASEAEAEGIANLLELRLHGLGRHSVLLDGEHLRQTLSRDLGHSPADCAESLRRLGEVARLMVDAGLIVITTCSLPQRAQRDLVHPLFGPTEFVDVHLDTTPTLKPDPAEQAAQAGLDTPWPLPDGAALHLAANDNEPGQVADEVVGHLRHIGWIPW